MHFMFRKFHSTIIISKVAQRHQEHRNKAFHWRRNRIQFRLGIFLLRVVKGQEDDVIGLRESHHKHHVDANETQKVTDNHSVYHHNERSNGLKAPEKKVKSLLFYAPHDTLKWIHCHLQKKRKYGDVVSIIATATWSSSSARQKNFKNGTVNINQQENKNITRDGAVL